jgi:hypothetical protein
MQCSKILSVISSTDWERTIRAMKLHQYFEFGPASQDPFSFFQIQLALDTVKSCECKQRGLPTEPLYNDLYPVLCKVVRMKPSIIIVTTFGFNFANYYSSPACLLSSKGLYCPLFWNKLGVTGNKYICVHKLKNVRKMMLCMKQTFHVYCIFSCFLPDLFLLAVGAAL